MYDIEPGPDCPEIVRMVVERPPEIPLGQPALLDHRAHRAVEDQDSLAQQARKLGGAIGLHFGASHSKIGVAV